MADLKPVRGTRDMLPETMRTHRYVIDKSMQTAALAGFQEMATPVFEFTNVFARTLGDTSDVVTKEMYSFEDKGGDMITLRPENTAGVARSYISNGLQQFAPCKFFYAGPMFRYERPQKGRLRQFHQIGVELIGAARALADVEVIATGHAVLKALGIVDKTVLELNTLGDKESRDAYRAALVAYFSAHRLSLSAESRDRLERNPLRILDSKSENDRMIVQDAPVFSDYLNAESRDFFAQVIAGLEALDIAYRLNPRLVRGLDYYCHTAFEFTTTELGAQGAVMAGGRYDGLIAQMGGAPTPGVGWAAGVERLSMLAGEPAPAQRPVAMIPLGEAAESRALSLMAMLRGAGQHVEMAFGGNMKKQMKQANKINARIALLLGDDELEKGIVGFKNLDSGEQSNVPFESLLSRVQEVG